MRHRTVTSIARVMGLSGENSFFPVPVMSPAAAQASISCKYTLVSSASANAARASAVTPDCAETAPSASVPDVSETVFALLPLCPQA